MDWLSFMNTQPSQPPPEMAMEEHEEDNEEDFYGPGTGEEPDVRAGAADSDEKDLLDHLLPIPAPAPPLALAPKAESTTAAEERRIENQKRLEDLRKQLLAKRQNTPLKVAGSRAATPASGTASPKMVQPPTPTPPMPQDQPRHQAQPVLGTLPGPPEQLPPNDALGLDRLIEEGRAAAEAKKSGEQQDTQLNGKGQTASTVDAVPTDNINTSLAKQNELRPTEHDDTAVSPQIESYPRQLIDPYYADLAAWLEITGYHDVDYRNSKLRTYKERKALEKEAARIAEKLEQLRKQEQEEIEALRSSLHRPSAQGATAPPPALPAQLPADDTLRMPAAAPDFTNGIKRAHSPPSADRSVRRRGEPPVASNGFRIRGATDLPIEARRQSPPRPIEQRISYPDMRRESTDLSQHSRDPSLERRQSYYRRDGERLPPPQPARPPVRYEDYDTPSRGSRPPALRSEHRYAPGGYASDPRPRRRSGDYGRGQHYRGGAGYDIPGGGQSGRPAGPELTY